MMSDSSHKRIADGIRVRPASKVHAQKPAEELVVHSYSPSVVEPYPVEDNPTLSERIPSDQRIIRADVLRHVSPRRYALWGVAMGMILIVGAGIAFSTVLSRATVRIKPKIEVATIQSVSVIFDTSVSRPVPEQKTVPAERLHFIQTSTQEVNVSGTQYVEARARGMVKISNHYSAAPQRLVSQTRFTTPTGALFRLASPVVIPGAVMEKGILASRSSDAELVADVSGEQANLSGQVLLKIPGFIGTPKYNGFTAIASNGFSGGSRGIKKIASDGDMQQAQQQVTKKAYDELKAQMRQKIPPGLRLVDGLQEIRIVKVETIEAGEKLMVRAIAEGDALVFHDDDVIALLKGALLPQDNTKTFVDNSVNLTYAVHTLNFERGRADALMQGSVKTKQPLTQVQADDLARALKGKKQGSVREFFNSHNDVVFSSLSIFPPWKSALPSNSDHITLVEEGAD